MQTQLEYAMGSYVEIHAVRNRTTQDIDTTFRTELDIGSYLESIESRTVGGVLYLVFDCLIAECIHL